MGPEPNRAAPPGHRVSTPRPSLRTIKTEVLIVGGSPAGVAAALAAAREGRRVILLEPRPFLGTVLTGAMLNVFDLNHRNGLSVVRGIYEQISTELGLAFDPRRAREVLLRRVSTEPRIRLMLKTRSVRVILEDGKLLGVLAEGADGRMFAVRAQVTVDATEDGDVAAAAGARYTMGREEAGGDRKMQPATLLFRVSAVHWPKVVALIQGEEGRYRSGVYLGYLWGFNSQLKYYRPQDPRLEFDAMNVGRLPDGSAWINGLRIFEVDGTNQQSLRQARALAEREIPRIVQFLRRSVPGFANAYLVETAPELYVRETRHIWGLYRLTARDVLDGRVFWDRITVASYPIDLHPYVPGWVNPYHPRQRVYTIPLRALIPERPDGLLVASRAFSATYQAAGSARVVPVVMALGEGAGVAAALAVERRIGPHRLVQNRIQVTELQQRLRARGASLDP
jgi:hypothetical protein